MSAPVTAEELAEVIEGSDVEIAARLASDLADARRDLDTERKASAMLADRCLDLGRELEALRAAVRAHEERRRAGWPTPNPWNQADLDLWAAAKAAP